MRVALLGVCLLAGFAAADEPAPHKAHRLSYPASTGPVDLGVGLWANPLPMDWDEDGDWDLIVACSDKPYNGLWLFENASGEDPAPVFELPRWIGPGLRNLAVSHVGGESFVLEPGRRFANFR